MCRKKREFEEKRKAEEDAKRKVQFEEAKRRHIANGGELDENGNIPVLKGYCSIIDIGFGRR